MTGLLKKVLDLPNKIVAPLFLIGDFVISLLEYAVHKLEQLFILLHQITIKNIDLFLSIKFHAAARLIWSRGRLGKKFRYIFIILFAWGIFMVGGVFQGSFIEPDSTEQAVFLASTGAILHGQASAATYKGEITLLDTPIEHTVLEGETLISIAQDYGISIESIKFANDLSSNNVKVDQVLTIPPFEGTVHEVTKADLNKKDPLDSIAKQYNVPAQTIVDFNYIDEPYLLDEGQILTIPNAERPKVQKFYAGSSTYDTSAYGVINYGDVSDPGSGNFIWPLGGLITQGFHSYHPAIDIANNSGDILAADKGVVVRAGWWQGGYGNAVQIDHGNGFVSTYAHMSSLAVSNGQKVEKGQKIGTVGSTGRSTGPHLHLTIQKDGRYLNPLSVLQR